MSGHTPGPWAVSGFDTTTVIAVKDGPNHKGQEFVDDRHQYTISRPGDIPDIYERAANARLIAESPELFWFAEQIFNGLDTKMLTFDTPADEVMANVLRRGRAAIAKVRGDRG